MTGRDRIVAVGVAALAILAAVWMLVVSPERQQASKVGAQVTEARAQLASAEGQLASARAAQAQYAAAYASIVNLGKAVPASEEVPSLIYQLAQVTNEKNIEFASIVAGGSGSSSSAATTAVAAAGFTQMPFTFVFDGTFFDLEHLFKQITGFTVHKGANGLDVSGRLLTIQSVKLAPAPTSAEAGKHGAEQLTGTITATAYVLPAGQGLTGTATPTSPTGAATPVSSTKGASSSPTAPAIARVNP